MQILICAATNGEIEPTLQFLKKQPAGKNHVIRILVTGVGAIPTAYHLLRSIHEKKPDYVIQAGIAGAFNREMEPGKVVLIFEEIIGDLGAEEKGVWNDVFDLGLAESIPPFTDKKLINPHCMEWEKYGLPFVRSLTVNEITTNPQRLKLLQEKYIPVVETMEGAAFHYVCLQERIPFMQIRSVSNFIGERNKTNWRTEDAIANLNNELIRIIQLLP